MDKYLEKIKTVNIFRGIEEKEIENMLKCLNSKIVSYTKEDVILMAGDKPQQIGIVIEGNIHVVKDDFEGNRTILTVLSSGEMFAEALCCAGLSESPVTVLAEKESIVMMIDFLRILKTCKNSCEFHHKTIKNMLRIIAEKNIYLQKRIEITCLKSVRAKILHYLGSFPVKKGECITIPMNREKMAEYLCVDRSALSHELIKMKNDGILVYKKNEFFLLKA